MSSAGVRPGAGCRRRPCGRSGRRCCRRCAVPTCCSAARRAADAAPAAAAAAGRRRCDGARPPPRPGEVVLVEGVLCPAGTSPTRTWPTCLTCGTPLRTERRPGEPAETAARAPGHRRRDDLPGDRGLRHRARPGPSARTCSPGRPGRCPARHGAQHLPGARPADAVAGGRSCSATTAPPTAPSSAGTGRPAPGCR